ncbi:hypothetical protein BGX38DRAFT_613802 [Terfezia claveryi]|nr:hypothetical protein BGX38DRAFT_613802 [Terfezia claveryi]
MYMPFRNCPLIGPFRNGPEHIYICVRCMQEWSVITFAMAECSSSFDTTTTCTPRYSPMLHLMPLSLFSLFPAFYSLTGQTIQPYSMILPNISHAVGISSQASQYDAKPCRIRVSATTLRPTYRYSTLYLWPPKTPMRVGPSLFWRRGSDAYRIVT